ERGAVEVAVARAVRRRLEVELGDLGAVERDALEFAQELLADDERGARAPGRAADAEAGEDGVRLDEDVGEGLHERGGVAGDAPLVEVALLDPGHAALTASSAGVAMPGAPDRAVR